MRAVGGEVQNEQGLYAFEGGHFNKKGFLFKNFVASAIVSDGVRPTFSELDKFENEAEVISMSSLTEKSSTEKSHNCESGRRGGPE